MKEILILSLFLCFNVTVFSQSIFEENGKFGLVYKGDTVLKAEYESILKTKNSHTFLLVQPNSGYKGEELNHEPNQVADLRFWSSSENRDYAKKQFDFLPSKKYGLFSRANSEKVLLPCEFSKLIFHLVYTTNKFKYREHGEEFFIKEGYKVLVFARSEDDYTLYYKGKEIDDISFDAFSIDPRGLWFANNGRWYFFDYHIKRKPLVTYSKILKDTLILADENGNRIYSEPTDWGSSWYSGNRYLIENEHGKRYFHSIKYNTFPKEYFVGKRQEPNGNWMMKTPNGKYGVCNSDFSYWKIEPKYEKLTYRKERTYDFERNGVKGEISAETGEESVKE